MFQTLLLQWRIHQFVALNVVTVTNKDLYKTYAAMTSNNYWGLLGMDNVLRATHHDWIHFLYLIAAYLFSWNIVHFISSSIDYNVDIHLKIEVGYRCNYFCHDLRFLWVPPQNSFLYVRTLKTQKDV